MREAFEALSVSALAHLYPEQAESVVDIVRRMSVAREHETTGMHEISTEWAAFGAEQLAAVELLGWDEEMWQAARLDHDALSPESCAPT